VGKVWQAFAESPGRGGRNFAMTGFCRP